MPKYRTDICIFFLLLTAPFLFGNEESAYSLKREQRVFDSSLQDASFLMKDSSKFFPGNETKVKNFFPPLQGQNLVFSLPEKKSSELVINTDQGPLEISLPASRDSLSLLLQIPADRSVQSITMAYNQKYSLQESASGRQTIELSLSLETPDRYQLVLPSLPGENRELKISLENPNAVSVKTTLGDAYTLEGFQGRRTFRFPLNEDSSSSLSISADRELEYLSFSIEETPAFPRALTRSGSQILDNQINEWRNRDFEVYSWASFPSVLVFDCRNYDIQNRLFRRLAFYIEKKGYVGQLLTNSELKGKHAWNAHDYRAEDLARFFNLVAERDFPIYPEESMLRSILISHGILIQDDEGVLHPGEGAVLSISKESTDALRYRFFVHEGAHGIFFTSPEFREFVTELWNSLDSRDRAMWRFFFSWYGYDPADEYLMINEFQAYLLQQRASAAPAYFGPRMGSLANSYPGERSSLERGTGAGSAGFQIWAEILEDWIYEKWGMRAGNFFPLYKELH